MTGLAIEGLHVGYGRRAVLRDVTIPALRPGTVTALLGPHAFLGSAVRTEEPDAEVDAWLASGDAPVVYVSLGSFLSVRSDVLARVAEKMRE